jgi:choline kinase
MTEMPPLALLSGGLALRLRPHTLKVPKAMIEVAGAPFIAHQLRLLRRERVPRVVLCVGYLGEQVEAFVGDGSQFGVAVDYCYDGPNLLGTGGALRKALPLLGPEFLVMYGDSWLDTSFAPVVAAFRQSGKPALMTVFRNAGRWDTSNIWYEAGAIRRYDKRERLPQMEYIDWGLSVVKAALLEDGRRTPPSISPTCSRNSPGAANSPVTRSRRASTRSDRSRAGVRPTRCCADRPKRNESRSV